jgi:hypothetical protein
LRFIKSSGFFEFSTSTIEELVLCGGDSGVDFNMIFDGKLAGRNKCPLGWSKDYACEMDDGQ